MRQIVNSKQMKYLDQLTLKEQEISSYELMLRAGSKVEEAMYIDALCDYSKLFVVVAGPGNNGGDALVVMRRLLERGAEAVLIQAFDLESATDEVKEAFQELIKLKPTIQKLTDEIDLEDVEQWLDYAGTIVDGLFGIGLTRNVTGIYHKLIQRINESFLDIISIDMPSGIHPDNGLVMGAAIQAKHTLVIQNIKQGHLLQDGPDYSGNLHIIDCNIMQCVFPEIQMHLDELYMIGKITPRKKNTHKYHYGSVVTIGGSKGMMGAPVLCAKATQKTGTGLSTILHHERYFKDAMMIDPSLLYNHYSSIEEIPALIRKATAIVFGPGLNKNDELNTKILQYLLKTQKPIVIDAGGLYYLKKLVKSYSDLSQVIITPHFAEMADFIDVPISELKENPVLYAQNIVHKYKLTVVLKGYTTLILNDDHTFFSNYGTPGLAKAGSGDVLAGIIASLLGRRMNSIEAAKIGVLLHSKTGWFAQSKLGEESIGPLDLIDAIPQVLQFMRR